MSTEPKYDNDGNLEARVDEFDEPMTTRTETALTAAQVVPFLQSVIASGERLSPEDIADIDAALTAERAALAQYKDAHENWKTLRPQFEEAVSLLADRTKELDAERAARGRVEAARLFAAHMDVEGGYILTPDRHSHAYWSKVAARYNFLTDRAALSPSTTTPEADSE